jgi:hypothetical protein
VLGAGAGALGTGDLAPVQSAVSTQHSALSTQQSAVSRLQPCRRFLKRPGWGSFELAIIGIIGIVQRDFNFQWATLCSAKL